MNETSTKPTTACHFSPTGKAFMDDEGRCTCEPVPADKPTTLESRVARLENLIGDHFMLTAHRRRYFKAELLRRLKGELSTLEQSIATHTAERDRLIAEIASYE